VVAELLLKTLNHTKRLINKDVTGLTLFVQDQNVKKEVKMLETKLCSKYLCTASNSQNFFFLNGFNHLQSGFVFAFEEGRFFGQDS